MRETHIKVHVSTGQTAEGFVDDNGAPLDFNHLPQLADPRLGVLPHTVQHYGLGDPAPTYGNANFAHVREFIHEEAGRRRVLWHPETAYWVSFDIDVPLLHHALLACVLAFVLACAACPACPDAPAATTPAPAVKTVWVEPSVPKCSYADVLSKHDYDALKGGSYCQVCGSVDDTACELAWPSSDVATCALLDEMRNEIFAYYGRPFEKERWQKRFAAKTWYAPSDDYSDARLSPVARANVAKLAAERARTAAAAKDSGDTTCADSTSPQ